MSFSEPWAPLHDLPPPQNVADVVDLLMVCLIWLDANGKPYASIDVSSAMNKLLDDPGG